MDQTVGNVLKTLLHSNRPKNMDDARDIVDDALATSMHAMRCNVTTALGSPPGALVYARDMFLNVPLVADWTTIANRREQLIREDLRKQNLKRVSYDYKVGDKILKTTGARTLGPYKIIKCHTNGNVTIELNAQLSERLNVRKIVPFRN